MAEPKQFVATYTGKMAICACERTRTPPFCDGRHRGTGKAPIKFPVEEGKTYLLCQCGFSDNKPFCDGSHEFGQGGLFGKRGKGTSW